MTRSPPSLALFPHFPPPLSPFPALSHLSSLHFFGLGHNIVGDTTYGKGRINSALREWYPPGSRPREPYAYSSEPQP
eukprot:1718706-Rhodomonas_salina.1